MRPPSWLTDLQLETVWTRLRLPLERGAQTSRLTGLDRPTRHALSALLGRPVTGNTTIVLAELDSLLQDRAGCSLAEVVEALTGPLRDRRAEREARLAPVEQLAAVDAEWATRVHSSGILARVPDPVALVTSAIAVRQRLPREGQLRTELAASTTGDAHALDDGTPLAAVVLRSLVNPVPSSAAERRAVWQQVGVLADTVSTSVLTLGLRPVAQGAREDALKASADLGDPVPVTPWLLRRLDVGMSGRCVLVVENPSVLESFATRHGGRFPVVCTSGWPSQVALDLLQRLGTRLRYHGDFDWRGVEICGWLQAQRAAEPWRMTAEDYRSATGGGPLEGRPAPTPWDPSLADAMTSRSIAVHEEQLVHTLLEAWPEESPAMS